jgi:3-oxoacyl-[acyl-carrier protein] reductase
MDLGLTNRTAFVAGASSGLGRAVALELLNEGARVALCSRDEDRITTAAADVQAEAGVPAEKVLPLVCDVTDEADVRTAVSETVETFGDLHVLVTNAGGPPSGAATEVDLEAYREAVELNLMSTISLCDAALPHLRTAAEADDHARIVMVTSVSAKQPIPTLVLSNTARAGVQGYAKSLADDLGPSGITVNTVLPGYTRTARLEDLAADIQAETGQSYDEIEADWADQNALPRIGEPEEFAATVSFLASKRAGYVTGVALPVDGGRSKHVL